MYNSHIHFYVKSHILTQYFFTGENIADNGGLKAAFHAFKKTIAINERDLLLLPGVNLTHNQLFFVSFAQVMYPL